MSVKKECLCYRWTSNDLQTDFKVLHFDLVGLIEDGKTLEKEQEVFDTVDDAKIRIKRFLHNCTAAKETFKDELFFCYKETLCGEGQFGLCQCWHSTFDWERQ